MTTPAVGAARAVAGGRVSRETMVANRKAQREASKAAKALAPTTPESPKEPKAPKQSAPKPVTKPDKGLTLPKVSVPQPMSSGAGFILALMFWTWIALPFLKNGKDGVRAQLKAKFTNKAPDGSWLP